MKRKIYFTSVVIACAVSGVLLVAWISQSVRLRVAVDPSLPPFEYISGEEGTTVAGFDIAIAERIAENARVRLEIVQLPFYGILSALEEGRVDMAIAAIPITPQRVARVNFSVSYYVATQVMVGRAYGRTPQQLDDLRNEHIAVRANSIGELTVSELTFPHTLLTFDTNNEVFEALRDEQATAIIIDEEVARYYMMAYPDEFVVTDAGFEQLRYAVATQKEDDRLLRIVNRTIRTLQGSSEYDRLLEEYILP